MYTYNTFYNKKACTQMITDEYTQMDNLYTNYRIEGKQLIVPRYSRCIGYNNICQDRPVPSMQFNGELRQPQQELFDDITQRVKDNNVLDAIVERDTAFGKTVVAIALITSFKLNTLILVNRKILVQQWIDRIRQFSNCDPKTLRDSNVEEPGIVIGTIQTFCKEKYYSKWKDSFNVLVVDECHTIPTDKFLDVLFRYSCRIRLGFSATPERNDKKDLLLKDHLPVMFSAPITTKSKKQESKVYFIDFEDSIDVPKDHRQKIVYSQYLTNVSKNESLIGAVVDSVSKLLKKGRKILFLSDRVDQIYKVGSYFPEAVYMTGKNKGLDNNKEHDLLLCTTSIAGTGLDCAYLDTVIFGTPKKNLQQVLGRIYRKKHNLHPIVVDFYSGICSFSYNSAQKRKTQIRKMVDVNKIENIIE